MAVCGLIWFNLHIQWPFEKEVQSLLLRLSSFMLCVSETLRRFEKNESTNNSLKWRWVPLAATGHCTKVKNINIQGKYFHPVRQPRNSWDACSNSRIIQNFYKIREAPFYYLRITARLIAHNSLQQIPWGASSKCCRRLQMFPKWCLVDALFTPANINYQVVLQNYGKETCMLTS